MIGGFTFAFFNYTRTGGANTIQVGRISFVSEQTQQNTINLTNAFPISRSAASTDTTNTDDVVINITGDTTYSDGIEYLLTATAVENTKNNKTVPISIITSASNLGTNDEEYYEHRGSTTAVYKILAGNNIANNDQLLVGYIPSGATGVNGSVTIRAFLDSDLISISDTYDETNGVSDNMGTTSNWVNGRTNFTTTEWNDISVSFKVKVEANEGTWVEEIRTVNAMNTFPTTITDQKANIKEVYFNKMGATRMQNAYNNATIKADLTYNNEGKVLAWLETNTTDNAKYNLIIASDGDTYFPSNCASMFHGWINVEKFEFNNVKMDNVTNMNAIFSDCSSLINIDLSDLGGNNLSQAFGMFQNCSNLENINLSGFNYGVTSIISGGFVGLSNLREVDLSNAKTNGFTNVAGMFQNCTNLQSIDLSGTNMSNVTNTGAMFWGCTSLEKIYVSNDWNMNANILSFSTDMFKDCSSLVGQAPNTTYAFTDYNVTDKTYAVIATNDTVGYLTDISLKPTS